MSSVGENGARRGANMATNIQKSVRKSPRNPKGEEAISFRIRKSLVREEVGADMIYENRILGLRNMQMMSAMSCVSTTTMTATTVHISMRLMSW